MLISFYGYFTKLGWIKKIAHSTSPEHLKQSSQNIKNARMVTSDINDYVAQCMKQQIYATGLNNKKETFSKCSVPEKQN